MGIGDRRRTLGALQKRVGYLDLARTRAQGSQPVDQPLGRIRVRHNLLWVLAFKPVAFVVHHEHPVPRLSRDHVEHTSDQGTIFKQE